MQGNLAGVLFNSSLDELPTILDSFYASSTNDYIMMVGWGWCGVTKRWEKHKLCSYTCIIDQLVLELVQKK